MFAASGGEVCEARAFRGIVAVDALALAHRYGCNADLFHSAAIVAASD